MWQEEIMKYCLVAWHAGRTASWYSPTGYYFSSFFHPLVAWDRLYVQDDFGNLIQIK